MECLGLDRSGTQKLFLPLTKNIPCCLSSFTRKDPGTFVTFRLFRTMSASFLIHILSLIFQSWLAPSIMCLGENLRTSESILFNLLKLRYFTLSLSKLDVFLNNATSSSSISTLLHVIVADNPIGFRRTMFLLSHFSGRSSTPFLMYSEVGVMGNIWRGASIVPVPFQYASSINLDGEA